jgi:hypothetical protein
MSWKEAIHSNFRCVWTETPAVPRARMLEASCCCRKKHQFGEGDTPKWQTAVAWCHKFTWGTLQKPAQTLQSWRRDLCVQSHFKGGAKKIHPNSLRCWMFFAQARCQRLSQRGHPMRHRKARCPEVPTIVRRLSRCYITKIKMIKHQAYSTYFYFILPSFSPNIHQAFTSEVPSCPADPAISCRQLQ